MALPEGERKKIALFTNVPERAVISAVDADYIYRIPLILHAQGSIRSSSSSCDWTSAAELGEWQRVVEARDRPGRWSRSRWSASTST